jgi:hypothetical protein
MVERIVKDEYDRDLLVKLIREQKLPFSITITRGRKRTIEQNRLQRLWCNEIAEQLGDQAPEEVRGYCKLHFGVPILRADNEAFCAQYDRIIKPLPYEQKLEIMQEPIDFPVTRLMKTFQKTDYLDHIHRHFAGKGLVLTLPPDKSLIGRLKETEKAA